MSRFILGDCIDVMRGFPDRAVDLIVTDPPYLVGFKDRQAARLPGTSRMNGCNRPPLRCTASSKKTP
jgi:DNA modification methylase